MAAEATRVLVIEDEPMIAAYMISVLEQHGYAVVGNAADGEQAIILADSRSPDVALVDINLSGPIDGLTVARELIARCAVPIVFVTANLDRALLERASLQAEYVSKPFADHELIDALTRATAARTRA